MKTIFSLAMLVCAVPLLADDWPQWRGANRDGVWRETGIIETIPTTGLEVRWRAKIERGYSGPVVAQGRVFVTDHVFDPELERVLCFDEATGRQLWVHSYPCDYKEMEYGNGPRASPTVHDGKVHTLGTQGHLFCLDSATGEVVWEKSLVKDFNGSIPRYGASAAPLVVGDLLIVCAGGQPEASVVALDRNTGELRWKALKDRPAYSAPIVITAGGCQQLIVWTADSITGFDPPTGKIHWQIPWKATFDPAQRVASPVWHNDKLLFLGAWGRGSKLLQLDPAKPGASVLWETGTKPSTTFSTPLFQDDDHFYAVVNNGSLACLEAATGNEVWSTQEPTGPRRGSPGNAHLTPNGDRVFLFNSTGHLILARLTPKGYQELGRVLLVQPTAGYRPQGALTWSHPAYANKCVFARNDRELVCVSLAANQTVQISAPKPTFTMRLLPDFMQGDGPLTLAFSPDGKTLALGTMAAKVKWLDLATGKELHGPAPHIESVWAVAFSPDGKWLASASGSEFKRARNNDQTIARVKLWDTVAGKDRGELTGHTSNVFSATFAPDSKTLATGSADQTVRLWDVATMKTRTVLEGHAGAVMSVAFSADSKTIASASADRTVKLWDATTGNERGSLKGHDDEVLAVAFSSDGKTLATGSEDWTVRLWDVATQKLTAVLKGHRGGVLCLAFSTDGRTLATGSGDETVKLWDVATATERATLHGHRSGITAVAFSPDARTLVSAGMDDAVRLWDLPPQPVNEPAIDKSAGSSASPGRTIRAAAISFVPVKFDLAGNANRLERAFRSARQGGAKIAVAPEGALEGYVVNEIIEGKAAPAAMKDVAVTMDDPVIRRFQELARELEMCLVFGFAERVKDEVFNCAVFIDDAGRIRGSHHKMQLAEGSHPDWWFNRLGDQSRAFDTPYGRCGIVICNERWNPQLARILALDGARFLVIPSYGTRSKPQDDAVLALGRENGVPVVEANVGVTLVVNDGRIVTVDRNEEGITFGDIDIPPAVAAQPAERDRAEREFLLWREQEMKTRYEKNNARLAPNDELERP